MSNPFNDTSNLSGSITTGGGSYGINDRELGPTSTTGWYSGILPLGKNIVYNLSSSSSQPLLKIYRPNDNIEMRSLASDLYPSGGPYLTEEQALFELVDNGSKTIFITKWILPNITTKQLLFVLWYDARITSSYPTTGSNWYSIQRVSNEGDLVNGPTWSEKGYIDFDGTNDYVDLPASFSSVRLNGQTEASINMSVRLDNNGNSTAQSGIMQLSGYNNSNGCLYFYSDGNTYLDIFKTDRQQVWANTVIDPTRFHMLTVTTTPGTNGWKAYLNGELQYQTTGETTVSVLDTIGGGSAFARNSTSRYMNGQIQNIQVYTTELTQAEILQNYYEAPIVTSGLVFALDAGNILSYFTAGSNPAYNLAGNNTSTLSNGMGFSQENGGHWVTDGTDDGMSTPDASNLDLATFSVEGWVFFNQHKNFGSFMDKGSSASALSFNYGFFCYSSAVTFFIGDGSVFSRVDVLVANLPIDKWHHIVGTYDGATQKFYVNGELKAQTSTTITPNQNANPLRIMDSAYPIDGGFATARIYDRALTSTEIVQNLNAQHMRFTPN